MMKTTKERLLFVLIFLTISSITLFDLMGDSNEGVAWSHIIIEATVVLLGICGSLYLVRGFSNSKAGLAMSYYCRPKRKGNPKSGKQNLKNTWKDLVKQLISN